MQGSTLAARVAGGGEVAGASPGMGSAIDLLMLQLRAEGAAMDQVIDGRQRSGQRMERLFVGAMIAAIAAPALVLSYLPMTDLPQHAAIVSMFQHADDPAYAFGQYYELSPERTPYLLPYLLAWMLAKVLPLRAAMHGVVFLCLVLLPLGVMACQRAQGKPVILALMALPLVYHRMFFWGFLAFNLAIGLALLAIALVIRPPRGWRTEVPLFLLSAALAITHAYGVALLLGFVVLGLLVGERRRFLRRLPALAPALLGAAAWLGMVLSGAERLGSTRFPGFLTRLRELDDNILGGFTGKAEDVSILVFLAVFGLLSHRVLAWTPSRWRALAWPERVFQVYFALNILLYFALPDDVAGVYCMNLRHAPLAALMLVLIVPAQAFEEAPRVSRVALVGLALMATVTNWYYLVRFDREARSFDRVVAQFPHNPRLLALTWDKNGGVMETLPYLHFSAYVQARKGGVISASFPRATFQMPVRERGHSGIPPSPPDLDFDPTRYDYRSFAYYYDYVLVRADERGSAVTETLDEFPFELFYADHPWYIYRAPPGRELPGVVPGGGEHMAGRAGPVRR